MSNEIVRSMDTVQDLIKANAEQLKSCLGRTMDWSRFAHIVLSEFKKTPALMNCTKDSVMSSVVVSARLGLEVGSTLGHLYLIPYKSTCTPILGYKGLIELVRRSGVVSKLEAHVVHANDRFEYELGMEPKLVHVPMLGGEKERGERIAVYAIAVMRDGTKQFEVMDASEVHKIKISTQSGGKYGPWKDHESQMWRKTVIRRLVNYLPVSVLPQAAFEAIQAEDEAEYGRQDVRTVDAKTFDTGEFKPSADKNRGHDDAGFAKKDEPTPKPVPEETGEAMTDPQRKKIYALMTKDLQIGHDHVRDLAQEFLGKLGIDTPIKEITKAQASRLIDLLEQYVRESQPQSEPQKADDESPI